MSVSIFYNGANLFSGVGPTPYVSRSVEPIRYGKKFGAKDIFTLEGVITGSCNTSYSDIINKTTTLFNRLSSDFKEFKIVSEGVEVVKKPYSKITSFNCDEDKTFSIKPYSISIECYEEDYFNISDFGVIEPSNEISYSEGENGEITIEHTVSAKGFKTNNSALDNAINYVNNNITIGSAVPISARILKNGTITSPVLVSENEEINRMEASYSITRRYICDARRVNSNMIFNSSVEISYDEESGIYNVSMDGSINGGFATGNLGNTDFNEIRNAIKRVDFYSIANTTFKKKYGIDLNPNILNFKVDENEIERSASFSCSFNSDIGAGTVYLESEYSISYDDLSELHEISFTGTIKGKKSQKTKWSELKSFYSNLNVAALCQKFLSEEDSSIRIEPYARSYSVEFDERNGTITVSATYAEANPANIWYNQFRNLNFDINIDASRKIILPVQTVNNGAKVVDIESTTRPSCSIQGSAQLLDTCSVAEVYSNIKSFAFSLISRYVGSGYFIEAVEISKDLASGPQVYNFNITVSYEAGTGFLLIE